MNTDLPGFLNDNIIDEEFGGNFLITLGRAGALK